MFMTFEKDLLILIRSYDTNLREKNNTIYWKSQRGNKLDY